MADLDLDALESLLAQATPAPWTHFPDVEPLDAANSEARVCYTRDGETCEWCIALAGLTDDAGAWTPETLARWNADARLIAAMRNALPALIARVREAERERDALREALARYGRHESDCCWRAWPRESCTCGLDAAKGTPNV